MWSWVLETGVGGHGPGLWPLLVVGQGDGTRGMEIGRSQRRWMFHGVDQFEACDLVDVLAVAGEEEAAVVKFLQR